MPSDFDQIAAMGPPGSEQPIPELENLQKALSGMKEFQATLVSQNQMNEQVLPPQSIQVNTAKGTVTMKDLPIATYEAFNRDRQQLNEIRGAFHQESERLKNQEQQARNQPPWVQLATALSANLASQKDMPGWVRGLGQTAAQMNPRPEQIQAQRMQVLGEEAQLAEKAGAMDERLLSQRQASEDRQAAIAVKFEADRTQVEKDASVAARTVGEFDAESYIKELVAKGANPRQAAAAAERLDAVAKVKRASLERAEAEKQKVEADKELRFHESLAAASERTDKMIAAADRRAAEAAARGETKEKAASAKAQQPGPVLKKQLGDLNAADTALDEIEKLLNDPSNQAVMGPVAGRMASAGAATMPLVTDPKGRVAGIKQKLMLQTAQAIKATGAGARGFGPQERPYFEQLAEGINRTPAQNLRIVQGWREFLDQERRGAQIANPDVDWAGKFAPTLGKRLGATQESTEDTVKKLLETVKPR